MLRCCLLVLDYAQPHTEICRKRTNKQKNASIYSLLNQQEEAINETIALPYYQNLTIKLTSIVWQLWRKLATFSARVILSWRVKLTKVFQHSYRGSGCCHCPKQNLPENFDFLISLAKFFASVLSSFYVFILVLSFLWLKWMNLQISDDVYLRNVCLSQAKLSYVTISRSIAN